MHPKRAGQCGPSGQVDYAYVTLGIVLSNSISSETIFYQIILADTRGPPSCPANDPCTPWSYWFFQSLPTLGYSESIANSYAGVGTCLKPGTGPQSFALPVGPRLVWSVNTAAKQFGSDGTMDHWAITGIYLGAGMEGSAIAAVTMSGVNLYLSM